MKDYDIEIQNLREENEELQKAVAELLEDNKGLQAQLNAKCDFCKAAIAKKTAKEILSEFALYTCGDGYYEFASHDLHELAKQYGVKVEVEK